MRINYKILVQGAALRTQIRLLAIGTYVLACLGVSAQQNFECKWATVGGLTGGVSGSPAVATDGNGDVYFFTHFKGTVIIGNDTLVSAGNNTNDLILIKYDVQGGLIWSQVLGGTGHERAYGVTVDNAGNIYIVGDFRSDSVDFDPSSSSKYLYSQGFYDGFVAKYNANFDYQWAYSIGGRGFDWIECMASDASGNVYVAGPYGFGTDTLKLDHSSGSAILLGNNGDFFLAKYDPNGNLLWAERIDGDNAYGALPFDLVYNPVGGVLHLTGETYNSMIIGSDTLISKGDYDIFLATFDTSGVYQWSMSMGGNGGDQGRGVAVDDKGNLIVTGYFWDIVDFDPGINIANLASAGVNNVFLAKYDVQGNYLWAKSLGGPGHGDFGQDVVVDANGNIYVTGGFADTADFDPGIGVFNLISSGYTDIFLGKYDSNGNYKNAFGVGNVLFEQGWSLEIDNSNSNKPIVYLVSFLGAGTSDFEPGPDTINITVSGGRGSVLAAYSPPCADVSGPSLSVGLCPEDTLVYGNLTITSPGTYTAAFPAANGCDSLVELTVTNAPAHTESNTASICGGEVYVFDTLQLTTSGTYTQTYENVHGCDSVVTLILTVNEIDNSIYISNVHTLNVNQGFAAYQWVDCDANFTPISGATNQSFTPTENGNYAVIVTTADGCTDTSACRTITNVGIEEIPGVGSIQLYPNPAAGTVYLEISTDNPTDLNLHLQDSRGRLVYERVLGQVAGAQTYEVPLDGVAAGVYHVVLQSNEGHSVRKLIVIE